MTCCRTFYFSKANSIRMLDCSICVFLWQFCSDLATTQNSNSLWPCDTNSTSTYLLPHLNHRVRVLCPGSSRPISRELQPKCMSRFSIREYMIVGQGSDPLIAISVSELSFNNTQKISLIFHLHVSIPKRIFVMLSHKNCILKVRVSTLVWGLIIK